MSMLDFVWPLFLLLTPLPWLVYRWLPSAKQDQAALIAPFYKNWLKINQTSGRPAIPTALYALIAIIVIWLCVLLAAARPQWIGEPIALPSDGRDLLLAVDISGSMQAEDMTNGRETINRLQAVKKVVGEFAEKRQGDRLGLILFGSNAYVQSPLTFDIKTVRQFLDEAQIGFAGKETAIGDAIGLAVKRLRQRPADSRVLILLTDGANTAGEVEPIEAAKLAQQSDITIYTVGIGADEMSVPGIFGSRFGARRVNPSADLDESSLRKIANTTGGRYFRAKNPEELAKIYDLVDQLEPLEQEAATFRPKTELFHWPLAIALCLSFFLAFSQIILSSNLLRPRNIEVSKS